MPGCNIRAIWILNLQDAVVFSRRFPVVEKRWRVACQRENENSDNNENGGSVQPLLPTDPELASAFAERKRREGSARGYGIRLSHSTQDSDSWIDDPITRHIITLHIKREEEDEYTLWPLVLHVKGVFYILVLPLVEPQQYKSYMRISKCSDCGNIGGVPDGLSSLLLNLPCITGYANWCVHVGWSSFPWVLIVGCEEAIPFFCPFCSLAFALAHDRPGKTIEPSPS